MVRCCTHAMGRSKAPAMHQNSMQCSFQHVGNLAPDFGTFQLFTFRFSNDFQQNDVFFSILSYDE